MPSCGWVLSASQTRRCYRPCPAQGPCAGPEVGPGRPGDGGVNNLSDSYRSRANLKILHIADLQRDKQFLPDVPTFKERGCDVDDSSVSFRGIMVRKGTPQAVIDKPAKIAHAMFANARVAKQMRIGGSPIRIMDRAAVKKMWAERQDFLTGLPKGPKQAYSLEGRRRSRGGARPTDGERGD